jgi:hypothetical protein
MQHKSRFTRAIAVFERDEWDDDLAPELWYLTKLAYQLLGAAADDTEAVAVFGREAVERVRQAA